jgi:threonyl-tRNA synthetase
VVGAREQEEGTVSVRRRAGEDLGVMPLEAFVERVVSLTGSRSTEI